MSVVRFEVPAGACGSFWQSDYGPLFCDKGEGHDGNHRCYGSRGVITWQPITDPIEAGFYRAVAESIAAEAFGPALKEGDSCPKCGSPMGQAKGGVYDGLFYCTAFCDQFGPPRKEKL